MREGLRVVVELEHLEFGQRWDEIERTQPTSVQRQVLQFAAFLQQLLNLLSETPNGYLIQQQRADLIDGSSLPDSLLNPPNDRGRYEHLTEYYI